MSPARRPRRRRSRACGSSRQSARRGTARAAPRAGARGSSAAASGHGTKPDSAADERKHRLADQVDSGRRRPALRGPELDAIRTCIPQPEHALGDLLGRPRYAEAIEARRLSRRQRGIVPGDDVEIRLYDGRRTLARPVTVLVDDGDAADHEPDVRVVDPTAHDGEQVYVRGATDLDLVGHGAGPACGVLAPRADQERYALADTRISERRSGCER